MSIHEKAEQQMLFDSASNYIVAHATGAGLDVLPPVWDGGSPSATTPLHHVRIATSDAVVELAVPHDWLLHDGYGHDRFRTEVEAALAQLKRQRRSMS